MMRIRNLHLIPVIRNERISLIGKTSTKEIMMTKYMTDRVLPKIEIEGIIRKCSASVAKSLVTSGDISPRRRVRREHLGHRLMMSPQARELEMRTL